MIHKTRKKVLSWLLSLALMLSLLPGLSLPAQATDEYPLWVGGVQVTSANLSGNGTTGTWSYNADTKTLALNGYSYTGVGYKKDDAVFAIYYTGSDPLTIQLSGTSSITRTGDSSGPVAETASGIRCSQGNLTIDGGGSGSLTVTGGELKNTYGISANTVTIKSANVTAKGNGSSTGTGILGSQGVTIQNATVNAEGKSCGISGDSGSTKIEGNSSVTATGNSKAISGTAKNSIPGTGWTDTAGNEGQANIAISTEGRALTYKKVQFPAVHTHNDITFTAWNDTTSLPDVAGSYYLSGDVTISGSWSVPSGTTNLCLNGHSITHSGGVGNQVISAGNGTTLNLYDESGNNGTVTHGSGVKGAGVWVGGSGTFNMYGGKITGNTNQGSGGGVSMSVGTFTMHGGTITGNNANSGGGVYVGGGTFTMYGGTITGNSASSGAGVYNESNFTMTGGSVTNNTGFDEYGSAYGGGVYSYGTFSVSGTPSITNNTANGATSNVFLHNNVITISGNLTEGASIGVTRKVYEGYDLVPAIGAFTSGLSGKGNASYFSSDDSNYNINLTSAGEAQLVSAHTHSFTYSVGTGNEANTITATCSNTGGCPLASSNYQATLTIAAVGGTYDGTTTYGATVTNNIPAVDGDTVGKVEYYKVDTQGATTGGTKQTVAPTDAGYYYASVTLTSGSNTYPAVKAFTIAPKALTISGATLTARDYSEGNKNVTVSAVTFEGATLTLDTDYTVTAVMADDTAGNAKSATVTVTLTNGNYSLATNTYTDATVQINKIDYTDIKTAAANLRGTSGSTAEVTLPALPTGASYGTVTNSNTAYFTVGTVAGGKVTVTAAKDFNQATESAAKTFTVAVSGATNYNDYAVTVTITPIFKPTQTITASDVTATYGDTGKSVRASVTTPTTGGGAISYAVKSGSEYYIDVDATGALTIKKAGTATVVVTAAETGDYAQTVKDVTVTINKATPSYTVPTGLTATYGQTLADLTLPNADNGAWSWNDATTTSVGNAGNNTFKATFTPTNTDNYNTISNVDVTVTVGQAQQTAPALKILAQPDTPYANGSIGNNGASVSTERLQVSTDGGKAWTDVTTLPYAAKTGTYQFMYKGDDNHAASEVAKLLVEPVNELREVKITSDKTDANLYKSGETNTLTAVTNTNVTGLTLEYAWYREGVTEAIDTDASYTLQAADVGKKLTVVVTDKTTGATEPYASVSTATPVIVTVAPTTYQITGNVKVPKTDGGSEYDNVANANVELRQGNTVFATDKTVSEGNYTFSAVPNGEYNIVVTDASGTTKTEYVKVENGNQTINVTMPFYKVSSKVDVKGETPAAVVAGLDEAAAGSGAADQSVTMTMEIESTNDLTAKADDQLTEAQKAEKAEQQAIKAQNTGSGASTNLDFLDMSVYKRTQKTGESAQVEDVHNLSKVLEILLPYTTANRSFNIFRYHGTAATKFTRLSNRPTTSFADGQFFVDDGFIAIYASGFSTYAIGYSDATQTPSPSSGSSSSGGSSGSTITVPVSGDSASVSVSASVSGSTATVKAPTTAQLDKVIGESVKTGDVTIDVSGLKKDIATVSIPTETVKAIEKAVSDPDNDANALTVKLTDGSVTFDAAALAAIAQQAKGSTIQLNLDNIGESKLKTAQKTAIRDLDVQAVYDAYMTSNGQRISDFKGGKAAVTVSYTLKDGQTGRGVVVWYVADDGKTTEVPTAYNDKTVSFTVEHFSNYVIAYDAQRAAVCPKDDTCPISAFSDASATAWYHDGVHYVLESGIMNGVGNGKFGPGDATSRAMIAQILWNMEGKPVVNYALSYTDVDGEAWYTEAVRWVTSEKIMSGYGGGKFGPGDAMTREQLVTIMYRYAQYKGVDVSVGEDTNILSYDDALTVSEFAIPAMQWAVGSGAVSGRTNTTLNPKDTATRAEIATIIMRYCTEIAK